jgi:fructokinase
LANATNGPLICVTLAEEGAALWDRGEFVTAPAPRVAVRDTVGAGDAFMAGLMAGLTSETDREELLRNACRLGAFVASHDGATPLFPQDLKNLFKE